METKSRHGERLWVSHRPADEEDGHLPHQETAAHSLEGVLGHEAHGVAQFALLSGLQGLQALNVLHQGPFLHGVGEPNLSGHFVIVKGQSDASSSWTIALGDGDVSDELQDYVTRVVEVLAAGALRDVQGEGQLGGVERTLLLAYMYKRMISHTESPNTID